VGDRGLILSGGVIDFLRGAIIWLRGVLACLVEMCYRRLDKVYKAPLGELARSPGPFEKCGVILSGEFHESTS
jgi:hypothetical protein